MQAELLKWDNRAAMAVLIVNHTYNTATKTTFDARLLTDFIARHLSSMILSRMEPGTQAHQDREHESRTDYPWRRVEHANLRLVHASFADTLQVSFNCRAMLAGPGSGDRASSSSSAVVDQLQWCISGE